MTDRPLIQVIVASTRPGRVGEPTAHWVAEQARATGAFDIEVVDLAAVALPMFSEPEHPSLRAYTQESTRQFSELIDRADGFVFMFPEYNHSYNAALKNALDHLYWEWAGKPVVLVSYGGVAAGARAAVALQPVLLALKMRIAGLLPIPFIAQLVHADGDQRVFQPNEHVERGLKNALEGLTAALAPTN